ncbi:MAG: hypothetical protein AAB332_01865, partial [Planctomycetota bacterium]
AGKLYRKEGVAGFFRKQNARGKTVLTEVVMEKAQELLNLFVEPRDIAKQLNRVRLFYYDYFLSNLSPPDGILPSTYLLV